MFMQDNPKTTSSKTLKPATHLSLILAWRQGSLVNFAYAQEADIVWSEKLDTWVLNSYLNGERARTTTIVAGDIVWVAPSKAAYLQAVNSGDTVKTLSSGEPYGTWKVFKSNGTVVDSTRDKLLGK